MLFYEFDGSDPGPFRGPTRYPESRPDSLHKRQGTTPIRKSAWSLISCDTSSQQRVSAWISMQEHPMMHPYLTIRVLCHSVKYLPNGPNITPPQNLPCHFLAKSLSALYEALVYRIYTATDLTHRMLQRLHSLSRSPTVPDTSVAMFPTPRDVVPGTSFHALAAHVQRSRKQCPSWCSSGSG